MKILGAAVLAVVALVAVLGLWAVGSYNGLVARREAVGSAWAQVENQYQRRMDLVPNLVATVKGAAKFEKDTLTAVTDARARAGAITMDKSLLEDPAAFKKFEASQGALGSALSRLLVVSERYPQLTATQGYRDLQVQLEGTENRIAVARRDFNDAAQGYNTAIKMFPGSVVAGFGGFRERPYFAADQAAQAAPAVKF